MGEHAIAKASELDEGDRLLVEIEGREIAVFNVEGEYVAYTNWCVHQAGPVCEGALTGTWQAEYDADRQEVCLEWCNESKVLNCPWHGWEYDVTTGESLSSAKRLPSHEVRVEDGDLVVTI